MPSVGHNVRLSSGCQPEKCALNNQLLDTYPESSGQYDLLGPDQSRALPVASKTNLSARTDMTTNVALPTNTSTRVLILYPGAATEPISASLSVADLAQNHPAYEAISYTWGPPGDETSISVDGVSVKIRKHLHECLLRMRSTSEPRTLWCDYLCIDQTDPVEKAHQVQIIGSIFASATAVLVWLGEHANDSEKLFHDWYQPPESENWLKDWKNQYIRDEKRKAWWTAHDEASLQRAWQWVHFWQRPYWRRTWIFQELRLAKTIIVHIGTDSMNWADLITARFNIYGVYGSFDRLHRDPIWDKHALDNPYALLAAYLMWQTRFVQVEYFADRRGRKRAEGSQEDRFGSIFSLVGVFKHSFCHDRRDKVYALHALEKRDDDWSKPIRIDYTLSLPQLVLSLLEDRYINRPRESEWRRRFKSLILRVGVSDKTAEGFVESLSDSDWGMPPLGNLFETLDFQLEDCHTVAKLAQEKSRETVDTQARRYKRISDTIIDRFREFAKEEDGWIGSKARWDEGEMAGWYSPNPRLSWGEDNLWRFHIKHLV